MSLDMQGNEKTLSKKAKNILEQERDVHKDRPSVVDLDWAIKELLDTDPTETEFAYWMDHCTLTSRGLYMMIKGLSK